MHRVYRGCLLKFWTLLSDAHVKKRKRFQLPKSFKRLFSKKHVKSKEEEDEITTVGVKAKSTSDMSQTHKQVEEDE